MPPATRLRYRYTPQDDVAPPALVVGYGTPPDHALAAALDALCDTLTKRSRS